MKPTAFLPLATLLTEGRPLCLAKLLLSQLYDTMDGIINDMKECKSLTNLGGPL